MPDHELAASCPPDDRALEGGLGWVTTAQTPVPPPPLPLPAPPAAGAQRAGAITVTDLERELAEVEAGLRRRREEEAQLAQRSASLKQRIAVQQERDRQVTALETQRVDILRQLQEVAVRSSEEQANLAQLEREIAVLGPMQQAATDEIERSRLLRYIQIGIWCSTQNQAATRLPATSVPTSHPATQPPPDEEGAGYPLPAAPPQPDYAPVSASALAAAIDAHPTAAVAFEPLPRTLSAALPTTSSYIFTPYPTPTPPLLTPGEPAPMRGAEKGPSPRLMRWTFASTLLAALIGGLALVASVFLLPAILDGSQPTDAFRFMDTAAPTVTAQAGRGDYPTATVSAAAATKPFTGVTAVAAAPPPLPVTPIAATPPAVGNSAATPQSGGNSAVAPPPASAATPSPALVADAGGRIPTGAKVSVTPNPPAQHNPATTVTHLLLPALGLESDAVTVTPVKGADGQMYWGVDATRLGLETPGVGCGEAGNIVLNGHNWVTYGVLMSLGRLHRDDRLASLNRAEIKCTARNGSVYTYRIFAYGVFAPDDNSFEQLLKGEQRDLTIYTCTNSGRGRIVIVARLEV